MELLRRARVLVPIAAVVVAAAVGLTRPAPLRAADPPWDPPPCEPGHPHGVAASGGAWFSLDPILDPDGWLAGQRLAVGDLAGRVVRRVDLPPESFASGPIQGRVLVGDDDGTRSRLRLVDVTAGCAAEIGLADAVIRSAVLAPDGRTAWEHHVNRATRTDEGVWRRDLRGGPATLAVPGLASGAGFGPTFTTDLLLARDGRLGVTSCGELRCRVRVLEPRTGTVSQVDGTGALLGIAGTSIVTGAPCHADPCRIESIDLRTGTRTVLAGAAWAAGLGGPDDGLLVHASTDGRLLALDLHTGRIVPVDGAGGVPVRGGSLATSGADVPPGRVLVAPEGRVDGASAGSALDPVSGIFEPAREAFR